MWYLQTHWEGSRTHVPARKENNMANTRNYTDEEIQEWKDNYPPMVVANLIDKDFENRLAPKGKWPPKLGCRIEGCDRDHHGRGLCKKHLASAIHKSHRKSKRAVVGDEGPEWWTEKYPTIETEEELNPALLIDKGVWPWEMGCRVKDCEKTHYGRGLCSTHLRMATNSEGRHPIAMKAKKILGRQHPPSRELAFTPLTPIFGSAYEKPEFMKGEGRNMSNHFNEEWNEAITAWEDPKGERWEPLTEQQEEFCQYYTVERLSATEAASRAGVGKGTSMTRTSIGRRGSFWVNIHPVVRNRLYELREELRARHRVTLQDHLIELARLREKAIAVNQMSAAISAEKNRGLACGVYVQRTEVTVAKVDSMSKDEVLKRLEQMKAEHDARIVDITPDRSTLVDIIDPPDPISEDGGTEDLEPQTMDDAKTA